MSNKWDVRFLELARVVGSWSKDPSTKVGAVLVRPDRTVAAVGFNGFPRGVHDDPARYADRETKYRMTVHAEVNALASCYERPHGYTLYVTPLAPCADCAGKIIQSGVGQIVTEAHENDRWDTDCGLAATMLREAGIPVIVHYQT